ncbi:hypothetical protein LOK49_LG07G02064 [Camellia lanceoleosa]|uniref:Uncharacterized protein n=1 Tax=Camellia lanceoleosa TaxID=1840588 RepID=A0ACC0H2K9_9ERIC|nr:hypothetical protein LOK49_LG07G02064 [Camellia lanceoleosa]
MNMGDTDYSMSTACNVPNRADSTKTGKKGAQPAEGIPSEISKMAKILGSFIENTNTTMVEIAHRIGYSHDLSQQRRLVNTELLKLPMSNTQRLMAASMIVKDEDKVDLFFSLDENDKMEWVSLLLEACNLFTCCSCVGLHYIVLLEDAGYVVGARVLELLFHQEKVNPHSHQLKLCDFGSAKMLVPSEPNISYICSRYYRAPELIFGATEYTTAIDMWSTGCDLAKLLLGQPLFPGESGVDLLVEIIKVLSNLFL